MTGIFRGFSEIAEMQTPTPTSAYLLFDVPPGTEEGDVLVVIATTTGATSTDNAPGWCYLDYEDGTDVAIEDGYGPSVQSQFSGLAQTVIATDGVHQSGHGRLRASFAPTGIDIQPDMTYGVLLAFGGADPMSTTYDFDYSNYEWQTDDYVNTACRQVAERSLHWVHVFMSEGPPRSDVRVDDNHTLLPVRGYYQVDYVEYSFSIALGGPLAPSDDLAQWYEATGTNPFHNYKWIVVGLPPILEALPVTATDAAGAVGSGRLPVRTVVS